MKILDTNVVNRINCREANKDDIEKLKKLLGENKALLTSRIVQEKTQEL